MAAALDTPGNANDVKIVGNLAYVADGSAGLRIISVTNPVVPVLVGTVDTSGVAWAVTVAGGRAYIADGPSGLQIIDVNNPAAPQIVGSVDTPGTAKGVDVAGNIPVVADGTSGIQVIDVSDPANPSTIGRRLTGGDARDLALQGNFAFVADYSRSFTSMDLTDPHNPVLRASTLQTNGGFLQDVVVSGRFAFGADVFFVNGVPIIDVGQPASPQPRFILDFRQFRDDNGTGITVDSNYVYLTAVTSITENGTSGDTRLYIGQYRGQELEDTGVSVALFCPTNLTPVGGFLTMTGTVCNAGAAAITSVFVTNVVAGIGIFYVRGPITLAVDEGRAFTTRFPIP